MTIAIRGRVLRSLKGLSLAAGNRLGLSRLIGHTAWRRRRLLILCYHGVSLRDEHEWNPSLYVSPATLARRLMLLRRNRCAVLPLGEAVERVYTGDLPERAVALTFDDGYYDFLAKAWPLLSEFGYPATVYLQTLRSEHNFPIVNLARSYVLWKGRRGALNGRGIDGLESIDYPLHSPAERQRVLALLDAHSRNIKQPLSAKDDQVRRLARAVGVDYDELAAARLLTILKPREVADLSAQGVSFQLHTHRHRTPEEPEAFAEEINENRRRIEEATSRPAAHFCYPSGVTRPGYLPVLESLGVVSATTTKPGIVDASVHRLLLPRFVDTNATTESEFEAWLHGLAPWLRQAA
jgi:peptidoglycan/xylan/chitin deacetylase (PgdA/CDA1 family)